MTLYINHTDNKTAFVEVYDESNELIAMEKAIARLAETEHTITPLLKVNSVDVVTDLCNTKVWRNIYTLNA